MNPQIHLFSNIQFGQIRVAKTEDGEALICLNDVATALGYTNPAKAVIDHCKGVTILETPTNGGPQKMKYGTEGNVYRLVMKSKLKEAEQFQDWVCDEVLPSIRKNGGYIATKPDDTPEVIMARALLLADSTIKKQTAQLQDQAPKVLFADAVATSSRSILIGELAKIITQNGYEIGQNRLFAWLREHGYLGTRGENYNIPLQGAMEMGLFEIKETTITQPGGTVIISITPKITGKGQQYFINKFLFSKKQEGKS